MTFIIARLAEAPHLKQRHESYASITKVILIMILQIAVSIYGGYFAAGIARKVGSLWIRRLVILVGFALEG
jgi:hypothetical protein